MEVCGGFDANIRGMRIFRVGLEIDCYLRCARAPRWLDDEWYDRVRSVFRKESRWTDVSCSTLHILTAFTAFADRRRLPPGHAAFQSAGASRQTPI